MRIKPKEIQGSKEKCFACDQTLGSHAPCIAYTADGQRVHVGRDCFGHVQRWNERGGYQPSKGGPKLYLASLAKDVMKGISIEDMEEILIKVWRSHFG